MKTRFFSLLVFALVCTQLQATNTTAWMPKPDLMPSLTSVALDGGDPIDIKVVVSQRRIWLVADEMPMKCLKTKVLNAAGEVVLEKCFTSKCAEWFLNIESLPKGEYTLQLGETRVEKFKR